MVRSARFALLCATLVALANGCAGVLRSRSAAAPPMSFRLDNASPGAEGTPLDSPVVFLASPQPLSNDVLDRDLADTIWTIEAGTYAGRRVPLSINAALGRRGSKEHFWRVVEGAGIPGIVGWKSTRYPIPLAFRHGKRSDAITLADSAAFWTIIDDMNIDFGVEVFRPATIGNDDPRDVIVVDVGFMHDAADGLSRVTWAPSGELFDVRVTFRDVSSLHDAHVVTHEMMHALGFGHTNAWASVVNQHEHDAARLTPEDVAYAELAMHARVKREWADTRNLIALAVSRESSQRRADEGYVPCGPPTDSPFDTEETMVIGGWVPLGVLAVVSSCAGDKNRSGADTVAVPAAAVDTTTNRLPGETPRAEARPATGVDTPITRKIEAPAPVKR